MNYTSVLHQIEFALETIIKIMDQLIEEDLKKRPTANKHSIGELLEHMAILCEADWHIANEATQEEMQDFYSSISYKTIDDLKYGVKHHFQQLKQNCRELSDREWLMSTTSYWGVTYTRYEWLLETLAHLYHHRGQLHAMLVHCYNKDPNILMFE